MVFESIADDILATDTNSGTDIFLYDQQTQQISLVSLDSNGTQAYGDSFNPSISADGRYIAFHSFADSFVAGDTNNSRDVFVKDMLTGAITRVSVNTNGTQGDQGSFEADISADGLHISFASDASTLISGDFNRARDIFVYDTPNPSPAVTVERVRDINPGMGSSDPTGFTVFNNALYFVADDGTTGSELWRIDSAGNASRVTDLNPGLSGSNPIICTVFNNALYFLANNGITGRELWRIDSTGNISLVRDINPGSGESYPGSFTVFNNSLYFSANDGTTGTELWRIDSTGATNRVQDINPGSQGSFPSDFTIFNNSLYFKAQDGITGSELWRIDSTGNVDQAKDIFPGSTGSLPTNLTVFNNALYFVADNPSSGRELWRLDNTNNASLVKDIYPGLGSSRPYKFTVFNNTLYFSAMSDNVSGDTLWQVDSSGNASQVLDIYGAKISYPEDFTVFNNTLYFSASSAYDSELWRIDNTGRASLAQDIVPGWNSSYPEGFTVFEDALYFQARNSTTDAELWRLDNTGLASQVKDISPGSGSSEPSGFTVFNGGLYFQANDGATGTELWRLTPNNAPILSDTVVSLNLARVNGGMPVGTVGTLIAQMVDLAGGSGQNNIVDPDAGSRQGIAITAANTSNGSWFYSTNNGATWNPLGGVSNATARVLAADANTRLYFQPNAGFKGAIADAITFRAWDQTSGTNGGFVSTITNGGATAFSTALDTASIEVKNTQAVDFNADGNTDLLWHNSTTGQVGFWALNGGTFLEAQAIAVIPVSSGWVPVGSADFTGDGKTDILWRNYSTGENGFWEMDGGNLVNPFAIDPIAPTSGWDIVGVGDFTNDGKVDILWRNSLTGDNGFWEMNGATHVSSQSIDSVAPTSGWDIVGVGDFTNDGKVDIL
jgi:ELWxxDGT repeat protein